MPTCPSYCVNLAKSLYCFSNKIVDPDDEPELDIKRADISADSVEAEPIAEQTSLLDTTDEE